MENTLIYSNNASVVERSGQHVISGVKPSLSFNYDELQYHQSNKGYVLNNNWFDMTAEQELEVENYIKVITVDTALSTKISDNATNLAYLYDTDWYITRNMETGVEVPADILTKRAEARASLEPVTAS